MLGAVQVSTRTSIGVLQGLPLQAIVYLVAGLLQDPDPEALPAAALSTSSSRACSGPASPAATALPSSPSFLACLPTAPRHPRKGTIPL